MESAGQQSGARVAALVATFRRPVELARLVASLAQMPSGWGELFVCDNSADPAVRAVVESAPFPSHYSAPGRNLGCGGGLRAVGEGALQAGRFTHLLVLDDDAVLPPDALARLLAALETPGTAAVCPLVTGPGGSVGWVPGLVKGGREAERTLFPTPDAFRQAFGNDPLPWVWAQGICLLLRVSTAAQAGLHRPDFWVRGEDLDFSLRLTAAGAGLLVPSAVVQHLPPEGAGSTSQAAEYLRHAALIQNMAYLCLRLAHGRRIAWSLPGAVRRFFALWGFRALGDAMLAGWLGGVLAAPAGSAKGRRFLRRFEEL